MRFIKIIIVLTMTLFSVACSHTVNYKPSMPVSSINTSGDVNVYEIGMKIDKEYNTVGSIWFGDSGFSMSCGYEDAIYLAREKAREIGADAVKVDTVSKPGFVSTCYRVGADIIEYKD